MDQAKLRAWWSHRQGLDGTLEGKSPAEVLERTGWARSVGGSGPYLGLFARAGVSREAVDASVAKLEIHELPSARGCTYVLPASDFALGLKIAQGFDSDMNVARKLGVTDAEIEKLCATISTALKKGPQDPEALREATGKASRNLGEEGKKKGCTTTLPLALGQMQPAGVIRRVPINGRLDQQRYRYALWSPNPLAKYKLSTEEARVELARRYFTWIGPATVSEFQWFSALGVKAAKASVEPLKLVPVEDGSDRLMFAKDRDEFQRFQVPKKPHYALVSVIDGISILRRDLKSLVDEKDRVRNVFCDNGYKPLGGLADLPNHAIMDRGRLVGLWEYDTNSATIAWTSFIAPDKAMKQAVERMQTYVRDQLGDARSFSLDSPKKRRPRVEALRKVHAAGEGTRP